LDSALNQEAFEMKSSLFVLVLSLAAGCGDNLRPESSPATQSPGPAAVGGSQVAHSKSFMLVTNISTEHAAIAKSSKHTVKPGMGGE
jgi:hypothetical protein